ncbi:unnamed protein product [Merluccius merluccius]
MPWRRDVVIPSLRHGYRIWDVGERSRRTLAERNTALHSVKRERGSLPKGFELLIVDSEPDRHGSRSILQPGHYPD